MGAKKHQVRGFTWCTKCQNWAWNWRLKRQNGKCGVCGETCFFPDPSGWQSSGGGGNGANPKGPKRGQGDSADDLLQKYLAAAGLANDPTALGLVGKVQAQAQALAPKPRPKCPCVLQREAAAKCAQKQNALNKASEALAAAEEKLAEAKQRQVQAAVDLYDADQERIAAQAAIHAKEEPPQQQQQQADTFGVDESLFQHIDEFDEEDQVQLRQFKTQLEAVSIEAKKREKEFQYLLAQARKALAAPKKKRKGPEGEAAAASDVPAQEAAPQEAPAGGQEAAPSDKGAGKGAYVQRLSQEAKERRDAAVAHLATGAHQASSMTAAAAKAGTAAPAPAAPAAAAAGEPPL